MIKRVTYSAPLNVIPTWIVQILQVGPSWNVVFDPFIIDVMVFSRLV